MKAVMRFAVSSARWLMAGSCMELSLRSLRRDQPAHAGERREMVVSVAEHRIDHGDALEVVADLVLHGHADAAMQLDRALTDDTTGASDLHLGGGDRLAALRGVLLLRHHGGEHRHRARAL